MLRRPDLPILLDSGGLLTVMVGADFRSGAIRGRRGHVLTLHSPPRIVGTSDYVIVLSSYEVEKTLDTGTIVKACVVRY